jgi:hypothetical protein
MTRFVILLVNACIGFTSVIPVVAQHQNLENGVALHGYDAVAYFTEQKAVKGSKEVSVNHQGVHY